MPTEMMVDADFLGRLTLGSLEAQVGAVEEAIQANASLFGGDTQTEVRSVVTHTDHCIVANSDGDFYKAAWSMTEDGHVELDEVTEIEVPVYEADAMTDQARRKSREVVEAMLSGAPDTDDRIRDLTQYVYTGARLTAEGVEDHWSKQTFVESDWYLATREQETKMRAFIGAEANRLDIVKPRFEAMIESDLSEDQEDGHRVGVLKSLGRLAEAFEGLAGRVELAAQIDESYAARGGDSMAATDFVSFVEDYTADLDAVGGIISDAAAVAEDGCVKCLARLHDGVAGQMYEWALAGAFIEKLARRFEAPQAA